MAKLDTARALLRALRHSGSGMFHACAELGSARMAPPRDRRDAAHRLAGALGLIARAHEIVVTRHGDIPRGAALVVANHISYLDPVAILPLCPAIPLAKHEVGRWPVIGPIANALGVELVHRESSDQRVRVLRRVHDLLAAGVPVLNFPEGTTTRGDRVAPFWRGSFGIAQRLGVPVVPLAIRYADPEVAWCDGAMFVPHYMRMASRPRVEVTLTFGAEMWPRTGESPEAMAERARRTITHLLAKDPHARISSDVSRSRPDPVLSVADERRPGKRGRRVARRAA